MAEQLVLPVGLRDDSTLDSFFRDAAAEAYGAVLDLVEGRQPFVHLCGDPGSGRTHLLEAAADALSRRGLPVAFVPLGDGAAVPPALLEGLAEACGLICIDDLDRVAGQRDWEVALFHLFNGVRQRGGRLLVAAGNAPATAGWCLPDLASRLASGLVVRVPPADDDLRLAILQFRATRRGLDLPAETGRWLLARASRRLADLVSLLAELDRAAWVHQRRLTLPFVREALAARESAHLR